jgi:hypothetical protein
VLGINKVVATAGDDVDDDYDDDDDDDDTATAAVFQQFVHQLVSLGFYRSTAGRICLLYCGMVCNYVRGTPLHSYQ